MSDHIDIKSLTHNQLVDAMAELGQPKFRVKQLEQWLYQKNVGSFEEMTNFSKDLRAALSENYSLSKIKILVKQQSIDGTRKYLVEFADGVTVETVGIPSTDGTRLTVCFSTQAGCGMGCTFCATGLSGLTRSLTVGEMVDQIALVADDFDQRVSNVVAMGQGEPFANYEAVLQALRYMNSDNGLGIGARHITVSTCGLIKGINKFAQEPEQFTLAISLHSAIQSTRDKIMPGVKSQPLDVLKETLKDYGELTKRRPSLEYSMIAGVNDDDASLDALIDFARGMLSHINLIPLNEIDSDSPTVMKPSKRVDYFYQSICAAGLECSIRNSRGADIDGACGQLRQRFAE